MPELPPAARACGNFAEVERGYTDELAQAEAARCLSCAICSECLSCQYVCKAQAMNHNDVEPARRQVQVGAVILAPGYQIYNAELSQEFGLGRYPNVVTSLQFERLLSASGPTGGKVLRPSDGQPARRIAFLQCVGSRDADPRLLLGRLLHVRRQRSGHGPRARPRDLRPRLHDGHARLLARATKPTTSAPASSTASQYTRCRISALQRRP